MWHRSKRMVLAAVVLLAAIVTAGCGGKQSTQAPQEQPAEPLTFKVAHQWAEQSHFAQSIKFFADTITQRTDGKVTFKIFPANSLVNIQEMLDAVAGGVADIGYTTSSFTSPKIRELAIFEIPGAYDPNKIREVSEVVQPILQKVFEQYGVVYLFPFHDSETCFSLNKIVHAPLDLQQLKIRTAGPWVDRAVQRWGAVPMTIPPADLSVALERGTVDGCYSSWTFTRAYKVHEQKKAVTFTGLQTMLSFLIMNKESWEKLTPQQQQIFLEVGREALEHNFKLANELEPKFKEEIKAAGGQVYELTAEERAVFAEKARPVFDEARKVIGPLGNDLLDKLMALQR